MKKYLSFLTGIFILFGLVPHASAISMRGYNALMGGNVIGIALVNISYAIDTGGGSIYEHEANTRTAINKLIKNINCPDCNVWGFSFFFKIVEKKPDKKLFDTDPIKFHIVPSVEDAFSTILEGDTGDIPFFDDIGGRKIALGSKPAISHDEISDAVNGKIYEKAPVPEPATLFLLGIGLLAFVCLKKNIIKSR